jgi:anti-sigma B factor antagonist
MSLALSVIHITRVLKNISRTLLARNCQKAGFNMPFIFQTARFRYNPLPMASQNMQIASSAGARDGQRILRLKGPLNIHTIFEFQAAVRSDTSPLLIVDFSEVPFIDSSGLGALVSAHLAAQKADRKLALAAMNAQVQALLDMTNVRQFFRAYPTIEDAEAASV